MLLKIELLIAVTLVKKRSPWGITPTGFLKFKYQRL